MESLLFSTTNNSTLHDISLGNVSNALNRSKLLLNEITKPKDDFSLERDKNDKKSSIYAQFKMDTNKNIDEDGDLIELLQSYSKTCAEYSGFLKERLQQLNSNRQKDLYNSTLNELDEIDKEKHLWHLLKLLYVDEQNESEGGVGGRDEETGMITDMTSDVENEEEAVVNEKTIVKRLEKTCPLLRRIRAVIEWLEGIARESDYLRTVRESMSSFSEKCANWEHTFHYLKSSNSINKKDKAFFSGRDFVTELDPDAPIRQNKSLHDLDQEDEYKIMEYIFAFIRAGDLDTARDFCYKIGQSWRAATLEGFKLYQDNNYSRANSRSSRLAAANRKEQEIFKNEGNFNRDIWRLMVYKLIKDEHFGPYEKAVYASLAGFVSPVLPVCKTYMDFIWAYFKGLYNKIIDRELRQRITVRDYINMPFDTDEDHLFLSTGGKGASSDQSNLPTISQIFERIRVLISSCGSSGSTAPLDGLSASSSSSSFSLNLLNSKAQLVNALKADLNRPYSIVLKYVISSGLEGFKSGTNELMDYLKTALIEEKQNGYLLRLSAHLALFYRSASFQIKEDTFIQILDTYSQYLIQHGYKEIIAYYLSHLPAEINIKRYSKFLQMIEDNKERLVLIKLAKERNMNVQAITLNIVDTLSKHSITSLNKRESLEQEQTMGNRTSVANDMLFLATSSKQSQTLTDEDRTKINAIDWILYDPAQRLKLLEYANLTMRYFLLERKNFEATRLVFAKIPTDSIAIILGQYNYYGGGNTSALNTSTASSTAEANFNVAMENLPQKVSNYIKEYLCFKEYIESIKLYNEWFEFFHKEKPQKPAVSSSSSTTIANNNSQTLDQSSSQDRTFAERMTQEFHLKQYDDLMSRWHSKAVAYSERARVKFLSVLKFPHGGWMCDPNRTNSGAQDEMSDDDDEDDEENTDKQSDDENMMEDECLDAKTCPNNKRQLQLQALRKLYLPNIAFVLVDMLAKMNLNKELIKISDLVAARHYKLFELFEPEQMRCFLNKIADSSINLIDSNSDYLGYN